MISNSLPICPYKLRFLSDYRSQFLIWKLWLAFLLFMWSVTCELRGEGLTTERSVESRAQGASQGK